MGERVVEAFLYNFLYNLSSSVVWTTILNGNEYLKIIAVII